MIIVIQQVMHNLSTSHFIVAMSMEFVCNILMTESNQNLNDKSTSNEEILSELCQQYHKGKLNKNKTLKKQ